MDQGRSQLQILPGLEGPGRGYLETKVLPSGFNFMLWGCEGKRSCSHLRSD